MSSNRSAKYSAVKMQQYHICSISSIASWDRQKCWYKNIILNMTFNWAEQDCGWCEVRWGVIIGQKMKKTLRLSIPSSRSNGIISLTASKMPLCLASWPSSSLAHALQHPHTEQPDSPDPQPQILFNDRQRQTHVNSFAEIVTRLSHKQKFLVFLRCCVWVPSYPPGTLSGRPLLTQLAP